MQAPKIKFYCIESGDGAVQEMGAYHGAWRLPS